MSFLIDWRSTAHRRWAVGVQLAVALSELPKDDITSFEIDQYQTGRQFSTEELATTEAQKEKRVACSKLQFSIHKQIHHTAVDPYMQDPCDNPKKESYF